MQHLAGEHVVVDPAAGVNDLLSRQRVDGEAGRLEVWDERCGRARPVDADDLEVATYNAYLAKLNARESALPRRSQRAG